ncbi:DgyrCDS9611 [Dimorphilus gyrociliatus]|uniref:DgyrCDS9611 n=1 Tax=Dimorphilus gyrociliatus TaxID=2664684 RepID=A0A7I8VXW7_9ANNE|nr:DgyrCDS9611 [Dimorphilus gyrociliatus]
MLTYCVLDEVVIATDNPNGKEKTANEIIPVGIPPREDTSGAGKRKVEDEEEDEYDGVFRRPKVPKSPLVVKSRKDVFEQEKWPQET